MSTLVRIIHFLFFTAFTLNINSQDAHKAHLNNLLSIYLQNPNYNPHTRVGDCAANYDINCGIQYSEGNDIIITAFNPIRWTVKGNPVTESFSSINSFSKFGTDQEYQIESEGEHICIPSDELDSDDLFFKYEFTINNTSSHDKLYYTVFYQNESYKHSETVNCELVFKSGENFYGGWGYSEDADNGLHELNVTPSTTETHTGYFRIRGNPRNEKIYYNGTDIQYDNWEDEPVGNDARMRRWARVPRVGTYNFLLVVTTDPTFFNDKQYLVDTSQPFEDGENSAYLSPFHWRYIASQASTNNDLSNHLQNTYIFESCTQLNVKAVPDLSIPISNTNYPRNSFDIRTNANSANQVTVNTIPLVKKFDNFTQTEYNWNTHFYDPNHVPEEEFIPVVVDGDSDADNVTNEISINGEYELHITNPATESCDNPMREHAGVNFHRLKYGKFRGKVDFPKMYTIHHIWKGINNTFWLSRNTAGIPIGQHCFSNENLHHESDIEFFPHSEGGNTYYPTGIDNEYTYSTEKQYAVNDWNKHPIESAKSALVVSNFDYSCTNVRSPITLGNTVLVTYNGDNFLVKRELEKVVVTGVNGSNSVPLMDDATFFDGSLCYEIEWKPTELIFKIGTAWDNLTTYGYFNSDFTLIPNVPMSLIIAQHQLSTFDDLSTPQDESGKPYNYNAHHHQFIPFWKDDIVGKVIEFTVE